MTSPFRTPADYDPPQATRDIIRSIKNDAAPLWNILDGLPQGREIALAKTKLEEAVMWAVKGVTG